VDTALSNIDREVRKENANDDKRFSETLPRDVAGCEALQLRHREYLAEINGRQASVDTFVRAGRQMIASQHVLTQEIQAKVTNI
jgi:hypothetical protein